MKSPNEIEFAYILLRIERGGKTTDHCFSVAHFQFAMTVHNYICARNDGREPALYLVSGGGSEMLNNRMEFERAKKEMERQPPSRSIIHPGFGGFPPDM